LGESGLVDIVQTTSNRIEARTAFIADVTPIGRSESRKVLGGTFNDAAGLSGYDR
jgi:hypothetical protein